MSTQLIRDVEKQRKRLFLIPVSPGRGRGLVGNYETMIERKYLECTSKLVDRSSTVVKVLCYKSEGRWFDPSWCQWILH